MSSENPSPRQLLDAFISCIQNDIIPLTKKGVESGSKLFGAAILDRSTLKPVISETNNESISPLLHGETNCIQQFFFTIPKESRPKPQDCIFLATHEPCSLCMSAITWSGFNELHYMFTFEDSKDKFQIPYDIDIYKHVFQVKGKNETEQELEEKPLYNRHNKYFDAYSFSELVEKLDESDKAEYTQKIRDLNVEYNQLSNTYQESAKNNEAAFK